MKHKIKIVHPGDKTYTFTQYSNGDMPWLLETISLEWRRGTNRECTLFKDSGARDLRLNDIVYVDDTIYQKLYGGWKEVSEDYVRELIAKVRSHPKFERLGAWTATWEVMHDDYYPLKSFSYEQDPVGYI